MKTKTHYRALHTMREAHSKNAWYRGDNGDWYIAGAMTRDSDTVEESNFAVMRDRLGDDAAKGGVL